MKNEMETSLVLRKHVVGELGVLGDRLRRIDASVVRDGGGGGGDRPRLETIRNHVRFLFGVLEKVKRRIDERAKGELARRKGAGG